MASVFSRTGKSPLALEDFSRDFSLGTLAYASVSAVALLTAFSGPAGAAGFGTEGVNVVGALFNYKRFVIQGSAAGVNPLRDYENGVGTTQLGTPATGSSATDAVRNYTLFDGDLKLGINDNIDCLLRGNEPYKLRNEVSDNFNGRYEQTKFFIDSFGITGACSYKFEVGEMGLLRFIGGVNSTTFGATRDNAVVGAALAPFGAPMPVWGLDFTNHYNLESDDRGYGYLLGVSYEIPSILLRAQIVYESSIDVDLSGTQSIKGNGLTLISPTDVSASIELPQAISARFQSGINETTLIYAGVRWQEWSSLASIDIESKNPLLNRSLNPGWSDAWTVEAGLEKKLSDKLGLSGSITWNEGIGGMYTDTWKFATGAAYDVDDNWRVSVGASATYLTDGTVDSAGEGGGAASAKYDLGADWAYAIGMRLQYSIR